MLASGVSVSLCALSVFGVKSLSEFNIVGTGETETLGMEILTRDISEPNKSSAIRAKLYLT